MGLVFDKETLEPKESFEYPYEGWYELFFLCVCTADIISSSHDFPNTARPIDLIRSTAVTLFCKSSSGS